MIGLLSDLARAGTIQAKLSEHCSIVKLRQYLDHCDGVASQCQEDLAFVQALNFAGAGFDGSAKGGLGGGFEEATGELSGCEEFADGDVDEDGFD